MKWALLLFAILAAAPAFAAGEYPDPTVGDIVAPAGGGIDPNNLTLNATGALRWSGRSQITSPTDGTLQIRTAAGGAAVGSTRLILGANAATGGASLALNNTTQRLGAMVGDGSSYVAMVAQGFIYTATGPQLADVSGNNGLGWTSGAVTLTGGGGTPATFTTWSAAGDATFMKTVKVANAATIRSGTGAPEGTVAGGVGDIFLRTDGGAGTSFCVKESGTGNTGWVCK